MNSTLSAQTALEIGLLVLLMLGIGLWFVFQHQRRQSQRLQQRFGSEYGRTVAELGSRTKAESDLRAREKRVERLKIIPLQVADAQGFIESWNALQARFIDDPSGVVVKADQLVREVLQKRGYPVGDFKSRAADISVHHPAVVDNYRLAQTIAMRANDGKASTEDLRKAVVHYRALFDDLLEVRVTDSEAVADVAEEQAEAVVHP